MARPSFPPLLLPVFLAAFWACGMEGCSRPALPAPSSQTVGGMTLTLASSPALHTGDNTVTVTIADAVTGAPVGDANITAAPDMRAPTMPGVKTSGRAQGNGLYTIPLRLAVATQYQLSLHIERPGRVPADAVFPIEAL